VKRLITFLLFFCSFYSAFSQGVWKSIGQHKLSKSPQNTAASNAPKASGTVTTYIPSQYEGAGAFFNDFWSKIMTRCGDDYYYTSSNVSRDLSQFPRDVDYLQPGIGPLLKLDVPLADRHNGITAMVQSGMLTGYTVAVKFDHEPWTLMVNTQNNADFLQPWQLPPDKRESAHAHEVAPQPMVFTAKKENGTWYVADPIMMGLGHLGVEQWLTLDQVQLTRPKLTCENAKDVHDPDRSLEQTKNGRFEVPKDVVTNDEDRPQGDLQPTSVSNRSAFYVWNATGYDPAANAILQWSETKRFTSHFVYLLRRDIETSFKNGKVPMQGGESAIHFIRNACTYDVRNQAGYGQPCANILTFLMLGGVTAAHSPRLGVVTKPGFRMEPVAPGKYYLLVLGFQPGQGTPLIAYYSVHLQGTDPNAPQRDVTVPRSLNERVHDPKSPLLSPIDAVNEFPAVSFR
jgi:hypothetical protein